MGQKAIFFSNRAEIFYGNSEDYYLSISVNKSRFWALFAIFDFLAKKLTHWADLLGHLLSRNNVSKFSDLGHPSPT